MRWDRPSGEIVADVTFTGAATGNLAITWKDWENDAQARVTGRIGGKPVDFSLPAP